MARLTAAERKEIPSSKFGLPKERKYPMDDKSNARNAKARASEEEHKGAISMAEEKKIDRKADKVLGKKPETKPERKESRGEARKNRAADRVVNRMMGR